MASLHLDQNGDSVEQFSPPDCNDSVEPGAYDEYFGAPEILPRVGDEFQIELPPLSAKLNPEDAKYRADYQRNFFIGLPIPVTCISQKLDIPSKSAIKKETYSGKAQNLLVPGVCGECWSDAEKASFLLGLYIFQKNFDEVRRFVESKEMDTILSFYYGEFYGSTEYHRWSDSRKKKSKKCVYGQKIFSGLRQQELLSRILPSVSEDRRDALLEVSKNFGDERISLPDYVSSLKTMVGINKLVEAVGIGTGKRDLTRMALEHSRCKQSIPLRPEIPTGKAWSSLTTSEIIKFLSGDYRLSKARSNDLFWEAVWPRLLARGWNSEEPRDQSYVAGFKNSLVFLAPGIKKFSRRKLVKGVQYFDSVADVLGRVVRDPGLIELDAEEDNLEKNREERILITDQKSEQEGDDDDNDDGDLSSRQRHCYLQPRKPNRRAKTVEFTVIDTSLSGSRIRELRGLPVETLNSSMQPIRIENRYRNSLGEITDESETTKSGPQISDKSVGKLKRKEELHEKKQSKKVAKALPTQKVKRGGADFTDLVTKRGRQSTMGKQQEPDIGTSRSWPTSRFENGMSSCSGSIHETQGNLPSQTSSYPLSSSTSSIKGSPEESVDCDPYDNINAPGSSRGNEPQLLIDLNLPHVSPETENQTSEQNDYHLLNSSATETGSEQQDTRHYFPSSSATEARPDPEAIANPRRHSTRNRPPTTRALEAVANGFLTVNRRRKSKEGSSHDEAAPRRLQRARLVVSSQAEEAKSDDASNGGDCNLASNNSEVIPEAKEELVLGDGLGNTSS